MANWNDLFGGGGLTMPQIQTLSAALVQIKTAVATVQSDGVAAFWTAIDISHTDQGYESDSITATADTTEQTIVDVTQAGVLTQVLSPTLSASGTITIRVTIDGTVNTFISSAITGRMGIGHFLVMSPEATAGNGVGLTSANDAGYAASTSKIFSMTEPNQALTTSNIGMAFKTSLKVTVQGSVNITGTAEENKALACYSNYIPHGL